MPKKSIFRDPRAQHFQVLHRSLRDPLSNDPDAPARVLSQVQKGKQRQQDAMQTAPHEGEAAQYDIFFDDTEYDYMQHLRSIGSGPKEALFLEVGKKSSMRLPKEVLPAAKDEERDYAEMLGIPDKPYGLQPDMDPRLREVLEALDDDAYAQDEDEDFFETLVADEGAGSDEGIETEHDLTGYEQEMSKFKSSKPISMDSDIEDDDDLDSLSAMPTLAAKSSRRKGGSLASSAFSMSSSSKFRVQGLRDLDDKFDEIEKQYEDSSSSEDNEEDEGLYDLAAHRQDISSILDDFLDHYQILGKKLKEKAFTNEETPAEQLESFRSMLREVDDKDENKQRILARVAQMERADSKKSKTYESIERPEPSTKDRWDCETVLSTYSNLDNHPRMLRLRDVTRNGQKEPKVKQIKLDPKNGMPLVVEGELVQTQENDGKESDSDELLEGGNDRGVIKRAKDESKEEKKARKQAVKQERSARRTEKKATKTTFENEKKRQVQIASRRNATDVSTHNPGRAVVTSLS